MAYKIKLQLFEGPLDLLLYLVKKDHLNIYDIPIAQVTEQYMAFLDLMQSLDLSIAGDFLVMAATLMQIKSKMLLPADETAQDQMEEDDPRQELVQQLLEYEKFKEIAETLRQRETEQKDVYKRPRIEEKDLPEEPPQYFEASIFDLITAFSTAMKDAPKELFYKVIKDEFTLEEKMQDILHTLLVHSSVGLFDLFRRAKNKLEMIVTFLAILELIRLKEILARQSAAFGEIDVVRNIQNIIPDDEKKQPEIHKNDEPGTV